MFRVGDKIKLKERCDSCYATITSFNESWHVNENRWDFYDMEVLGDETYPYHFWIKISDIDMRKYKIKKILCSK